MPLRPRMTIALLGAAVALVAGVWATPAIAASGATSAVLAQCAQPGGLTGNFTVGQLRHALVVLPPETREYTSCPDVINRAILAALRKRGKGVGPVSTGSGSGSFLPTPVIVILVVLVLGAVTFGAVAIRRRRGDTDGSGPPKS